MTHEGTPSKRAHVCNVLLIEEDPNQTDLYSDLLREVADCSIDVVGRVDGSFEWFGKFNYYHLVIVDATTGFREAFDELYLLERIRRVSPMTSVIIVSDRATVEQAVAAIRMGAEDYLKKPFNLESFKLAAKRGLDRKAVYGDNAGASSYLSLLNSCQMISATLEQDKVFAIVQGYFSRELHSNHSVVYAAVKNGSVVRLDDVGHDASHDRAMEEILDIAVQAASPLKSMIDGSEFYRFVERGQLTPGLFVFRFRCVGDTEFFCVCLSPEKPVLLEAFESRIRMLRTQIELTGKNIQQYMGVQHLVYVDDATGLYNTRYLNNILDREIAQSQSGKKPFSVLFIDADHFKRVNDGHGHLVGTRLLNELGHQLKKHVRDTDTVFRYGGDEFVAVLSPCDLTTAKTVAERIRQSVEKRTFLAREGLNVRFTVSIGVALFPDHADTKKAIIDMADKAMYSAKRLTRNAVIVAEPGGKFTTADGKPAEPAGPGEKDERARE